MNMKSSTHSTSLRAGSCLAFCARQGGGFDFGIHREKEVKVPTLPQGTREGWGTLGFISDFQSSDISTVRFADANVQSSQTLFANRPTVSACRGDSSDSRKRSVCTSSRSVVTIANRYSENRKLVTCSRPGSNGCASGTDFRFVAIW
jgi:hypothetical protein